MNKESNDIKINITTNKDTQNKNILDSLDIDALEEDDIELLKNFI